jgi:hypothetical protein
MAPAGQSPSAAPSYQTDAADAIISIEVYDEVPNGYQCKLYALITYKKSFT